MTAPSSPSIRNPTTLPDALTRASRAPSGKPTSSANAVGSSAVSSPDANRSILSIADKASFPNVSDIASIPSGAVVGNAFCPLAFRTSMSAQGTVKIMAHTIADAAIARFALIWSLIRPPPPCTYPRRTRSNAAAGEGAHRALRSACPSRTTSA